MLLQFPCGGIVRCNGLFGSDPKSTSATDQKSAKRHKMRQHEGQREVDEQPDQNYACYPPVGVKCERPGCKNLRLCELRAPDDEPGGDWVYDPDAGVEQPWMQEIMPKKRRNNEDAAPYDS
jgi:hypothetical protein